MPGEKNHYIPEFYLDAWRSAPGEELYVYQKPSSRGVIRQRKHPGGTGYLKGLYTAPGLTGTAAYWIEDGFLQLSDDRASRAHKLMREGNINRVQGDLKNAWSRFIITIWNRNPEKIAWLKAEWRTHCDRLLDILRETETQWAGRPGQPASFEEYLVTKKSDDEGRHLVRLMQTIMDLERVGQKLNDMRWALFTLQNLPTRLLTSDRPVLMWGGIGSGCLAFPISPERVFFAYNAQEQRDGLQSYGPYALVQILNAKICKQAQKFLFSADSNMSEFIDLRLGRYPIEVYRATFHKDPG